MNVCIRIKKWIKGIVVLIIWFGSQTTQGMGLDLGFADDIRTPKKTSWELVSQTGGYVGAATAGVGYLWANGLRVAGQVGYTPEALGGHDIFAFALQTSYDYFDFSLMQKRQSLFASLSLLYSPDHQLFVTLPERYPDRYYPPTALAWLLGLGLNSEINQNWDVFAELTVQISTLEVVSASPTYLSLKEIASSALGIRWQY